MRVKASQIALGGMLSAVAVVIMSLGSLIPVNTYLCPVLCILITRPVMEKCGSRIAFCYYGAVSILSLLLAPDREAAVVYVFLGYYPMVKGYFDRIPSGILRICAKTLFFSVAGCAAYALMMYVMGLTELMEEFKSGGIWLAVCMVAVWDILFLLVDRVLVLRLRRYR